jgi:hypothetical protein
MQQRERLLAKIAGGAALVAAVQFGYSFVQSAFDERQLRIDVLHQELDDQRTAEMRGRRAKKQLDEWNRRSLPSDLVKARSLYQNWLANTVEKIRLAKAEVTSSPPMPRLGIYNRLPFTVRGQGTLSQVTQLLYEFYRADHLHQLQRFTLTPIESTESAQPGGGPGSMAGFPWGGGFRRGRRSRDGASREESSRENPGAESSSSGGASQVASREGAAPPGPTSEGTPTGGPTSAAPGSGDPASQGSRQAGDPRGGDERGGSRPEGRMRGWPMGGGFASMFSPQSRLMFDVSLSIEALVLPRADRQDQLNEATSDRLAFKDLEEYRRPIANRNVFAPYSEAPEVSDASKDAFVTAIMKVDGRLQAWLSLRTWNRRRELYEGDQIDVGSVHATVARIDAHAIEIEFDGKRRRVALGDSLADGKEVFAEEPSNDEAGAAETPETELPADETPAADKTPATASPVAEGSTG